MKKLYLLQDGTHADPSACKRGKDGVLRHENGLAVCLYENGEPQTVEEDAVRNKNVEAAKVGDQDKQNEPVRPLSEADVKPKDDHDAKGAKTR